MENIPDTLQQLLYDFLAFLPSLVTALIIFVASMYAAGLLAKIIKRSLERRNADSAFVLLLVKIARYTLIGMGTFAALQQIGFNLSAFLTGLGILGFTIGFALQDVSKNFISGLLLLLEQPFDKGDMIEVANYLGKVSKIDIRTTELHTLDGQNVTIPNGEVFNNPILNYSRYPKRRVDIAVGVAYGSDLEMVRQAATQAAAAIPGVLATPAPSVIFNEFGDSAIHFKLYCWIDLKTINYPKSIDALIVAVDAAFREHKIEIPYPIHTVLTHS